MPVRLGQNRSPENYDMQEIRPFQENNCPNEGYFQRGISDQIGQLKSWNFLKPTVFGVVASRRIGLNNRTQMGRIFGLMIYKSGIFAKSDRSMFLWWP